MTNIEGVFLFQPQVFEDFRGDFYEAFRPDQCLAETGFDFNVAQINTSVSKKGTIRGIHFKKFRPGQAKFVSVPKGRVIDVVIDLRKSSNTFLQWSSFELSAANRQSLLIGYGLGHAFLSLEDGTNVSYLCDSVFQPELEFGINPMQAGIDWATLSDEKPLGSFYISPKDEFAPTLEDASDLFFD
jgi:dTDP-4-dehydrorhamnose 3,5-epimerase